MATSSDLPFSSVPSLSPLSPNLSSLSPLSPNLSFLISNLKLLISVKLDPTNYTVWRSQFENILRAYDLYKYVDGSHPCPSPDLIDSTGNLISETPMHTWMMTNAHLLSCLTTTLTDPLKSFVLNMRYASDVWSVFEKRFTRLSRSHIHKLKDSLNSMTKGVDNMEAYLEKIKEAAEKLEVAYAPISDEDLVYITLNGLPLEYLPINQNYCNGKHNCQIPKKSAVQFTDITYSIQVTSATKEAIALKCSDIMGCTNIKMDHKLAVQITDITYSSFRVTSATKEAIALKCSDIMGTNIIMNHVNIISSVPRVTIFASCKNVVGKFSFIVLSVACLLSL